jgi:catechol 2,3-dioxygenase-like lactoylglutathione lyase family enzyme
MKLAKPHFDIGVMTERLEEMLAFWQGPVGLPFEEILPTGGGNHQHRHAVNGSIFKLNHPRKGLPKVSPSGYRKLWIAREGLKAQQELVDPDGNRVVLVPKGESDIEGVAITVGVRDPEAHARFYTNALQLEELTRKTGLRTHSVAMVWRSVSGDNRWSEWIPTRYITGGSISQGSVGRVDGSVRCACGP